MRTTVDRSSPWGQRLYFEGHEFDGMMDEVRLKAGQLSIIPGRGVDVEAIFENVYKVVPDYVDLPDGVLGKTVFYRDGRFDVLLSRQLANEAETNAVARRRLRATAAHECAHVVEHGHLHLVDTLTLSLFGDAERPPPKVLCRQESVANFGYDGQWWEYQANRGMASLLLPKRIVGQAVQELLESKHYRTIEEAIRAGGVEDIIRGIVHTFEASMQLVMYRLQEIGTLPNTSAQTALAMETPEN